MVNTNTLREVLEAKFSEEELRTFCVDLSLDYASLSGENKEAKARELVAYFERRDDLERLITAIQESRPGIIINHQHQPVYRHIRRKEYIMPPTQTSDSSLSQNQLDRLIAAVDRLTEKLGMVSTEVALLTQRMSSIDTRLISVENEMRDFTGIRASSPQTYIVIASAFGLALIIGLLLYIISTRGI